MAIIRKRSNISVINTYHLRDKRLSLNAKGLFSIMLVLGKEDPFLLTSRELVSMCKEDKSILREAMEELKTYGYLELIEIEGEKVCPDVLEQFLDVIEEPKKGEK